jgi:hypothetical protein
LQKLGLQENLTLYLAGHFKACKLWLDGNPDGSPKGGLFYCYAAFRYASQMSITHHGETFEGYNKPKRTPNHPTKSHAVLAKSGDEVKLIRFGQQGVRGAGSNPRTEKEKERQRSFKARHAENIAKGKMSAAYWADKVKW